MTSQNANLTDICLMTSCCVPLPSAVLIKIYLILFQQSRRIVRSIGDDDEDFDDDDLESLRLAALRSMGSKVRKILMKLHFVLDCTSLLNSK